MNKTKTVYTLCGMHTQMQIDVNKKIFNEIHKTNDSKQDEYKSKTKRRLRLFGFSL